MEAFELIKWVLDVSLKQLCLNPSHNEADGKEKFEIHPGVYASPGILAKIICFPWRQS